ncbi:MAG: stage II sporulation protein D [Firmicutes bacterium]|nr:stage II sporulation protein D [Bacillota bacterium]
MNDIFYIRVFNKRNKKVSRVPIEYIVTMAVAAQAPIKFHEEFLKVQSIIARTILIKKIKALGGKGCTKYDRCDICDEGHCINMASEKSLKEKWKEDYNKNMEIIKRAVKSTEDLIITMDNKPIDARFHNSCGGSTENAENVLGNKVLYLRKVLCDNCVDSPDWDKEKVINIKDLQEKLGVKFPKLNYKLDVDIKGFIEDIKRDEQGRIQSMKIGDKVFKGIEIMDILNLKSTKFSMSPLTIKVKSRGRGDGLGLCQCGANEMAKEGFLYEDIINYYYTGVEIKKVEKPCINKPLQGKIFILDPGHGGSVTTDNVGVNGLREKDVVLKICKLLKKSLTKLGATIHLTRDSDIYIPLNKRVNLVNDIRPDFLLSIHLNYFPNSSIKGCEIYHFKNDTDSFALGKFIINNIKDLDIIAKGVRSAEFFMLRECGVSSLHIEVDYLSNPLVEEKLRSDDYLTKITSKITEGILEFYEY